MANCEDNKWTLVYDGAIEENAEGAVNLREVRYPNDIGLEITANLYLPAGHSEDGSYAAIVVAHPNGGVKERVSGLFAQRLAGHGYVALAFGADAGVFPQEVEFHALLGAMETDNRPCRRRTPRRTTLARHGNASFASPG